MPFKTEHPFVPLVVTKGDLMLANLFMGFFIGFGYFATYHAVKETKRAKRLSTYIFLCWGEIVACVAYAILAYLYLVGATGPSLGLFFGIALAWTFQVHFLLQIIINRVCILLMPRSRIYLKFSVAALWTLICMSVFVIWIPTQLQINQRFQTINNYWDRVEKCLYLVTDGILNFFFIYTVKTRLVNHGLKKYDRLVRFNQNIVFVSLAMDCILIGLMSMPNHFVYCQFHSVAFIIKLNIEIAMSGLIIKVAQSTGITAYKSNNGFSSITNVGSGVGSVSLGPMKVRVDTDVAKSTGPDYDEDLELSSAKRWKEDAGTQNDHGCVTMVTIPEGY